MKERPDPRACFRTVVEGLTLEPIVIEECSANALPIREGRAVPLEAETGGGRIKGRFVVDRVGWSSTGEATVFVRPEG